MAAPNPQAHLRHFLATVDDYESLASTYKMPESINLLGHGEDTASRWVVVMHSLLLRKYFAPTDKLYLPTVVESVRACVVTDDFPPSEWYKLGSYLQSRPDGPAIAYRGTRAFTAADVWTVELYGRYLHGDYEKWQSAVAAGERITDTQLYSAAVESGRRVLAVAGLVRGGLEAGAISLGDDE